MLGGEVELEINTLLKINEMLKGIKNGKCTEVKTIKFGFHVTHLGSNSDLWS